MKSSLSLIVLVCAIGCDVSSDEDDLAAMRSSSDETRAAVVRDPSSSWSDQIAAVRSGNRDSVRVAEDELVSASEFQELASGCEGLTSLWIEKADLSDEDLRLLTTLPGLSWLRLPTRINDRGISFIADCKAITNLNLPNGRFTDAGFAKLASLPHLETLRVGSPNLTDDGLAVLQQLPHLRFLHLIGVPITDAGLEHVANAASLESFYLDGGMTTDSGLRSLLRERPDLHFHKDQQHLADDPNSHDHE